MPRRADEPGEGGLGRAAGQGLVDDDHRVREPLELVTGGPYVVPGPQPAELLVRLQLGHQPLGPGVVGESASARRAAAVCAAVSGRSGKNRRASGPRNISRATLRPGSYIAASARAGLLAASTSPSTLSWSSTTRAYGLFGVAEETTEEQARAQLDTNVLGPLWVTQAALPVLLAQEVGPLGLRVTIVEPCPYGTDWSGSSAVHTDPLAACEPIREARRAGAAARAPQDPRATADAPRTAPAARPRHLPLSGRRGRLPAAAGHLERPTAPGVPGLTGGVPGPVREVRSRVGPPPDPGQTLERYRPTSLIRTVLRACWTLKRHRRARTGAASSRMRLAPIVPAAATWVQAPSRKASTTQRSTC